jgi:hypothetical protein
MPQHLQVQIDAFLSLSALLPARDIGGHHFCWEQFCPSGVSPPRTHVVITAHATERTIGPKNSPTIP